MGHKQMLEFTTSDLVAAVTANSPVMSSKRMIIFVNVIALLSCIVLFELLPECCLLKQKTKAQL